MKVLLCIILLGCTFAFSASQRARQSYSVRQSAVRQGYPSYLRHLSSVRNGQVRLLRPAYRLRQRPLRAGGPAYLKYQMEAGSGYPRYPSYQKIRQNTQSYIRGPYFQNYPQYSDYPRYGGVGSAAATSPDQEAIPGEMIVPETTVVSDAGPGTELAPGTVVVPAESTSELIKQLFIKLEEILNRPSVVVPAEDVVKPPVPPVGSSYQEWNAGYNNMIQPVHDQSNTNQKQWNQSPSNEIWDSNFDFGNYPYQSPQALTTNGGTNFIYRPNFGTQEPWKSYGYPEPQEMKIHLIVYHNGKNLDLSPDYEPTEQLASYYRASTKCRFPAGCKMSCGMKFLPGVECPVCDCAPDVPCVIPRCGRGCSLQTYAGVPCPQCECSGRSDYRGISMGDNIVPGSQTSQYNNMNNQETIVSGTQITQNNQITSPICIPSSCGSGCEKILNEGRCPCCKCNGQCVLPTCPEACHLEAPNDVPLDACPQCLCPNNLKDNLGTRSERMARITNCHEEPDVGPCIGFFQLYYFDTKTRTCEIFTYGGCGGTANKYRSYEECFKACGVRQRPRHAVRSGRPAYLKYLMEAEREDGQEDGFPYCPNSWDIPVICRPRPICNFFGECYEDNCHWEMIEGPCPTCVCDDVELNPLHVQFLEDSLPYCQNSDISEYCRPRPICDFFGECYEDTCHWEMIEEPCPTCVCDDDVVESDQPYKLTSKPKPKPLPKLKPIPEEGDDVPYCRAWKVNHICQGFCRIFFACDGPGCAWKYSEPCPRCVCKGVDVAEPFRLLGQSPYLAPPTHIGRFPYLPPPPHFGHLPYLPRPPFLGRYPYIQPTPYLGSTQNCTCDLRYHQHYKAKGCKAVYSEGCDCPVRYYCSEVTLYDYTACYHNGRKYKNLQRIKSTNPCHVCFCYQSLFTRLHSIQCLLMERPSTSGSVQLEEGCFAVNDLKHCAPVGIKCENEIGDEPTCDMNGKTYHLGELIPSGDNCLRCICDEYWTGTLSSSSCIRLDCMIEKNRDDLQKGCLPIYHEATCCPIEFYCPTGTEEVVPQLPNQQTSDQCVFDDKVGNLGDVLIITQATNCITCTCTTPPDFTCISKECPFPPDSENCKPTYTTGECCATYTCPPLTQPNMIGRGIHRGINIGGISIGSPRGLKSLTRGISIGPGNYARSGMHITNSETVVSGTQFIQNNVETPCFIPRCYPGCSLQIRSNKPCPECDCSSQESETPSGGESTDDGTRGVNIGDITVPGSQTVDNNAIINYENTVNGAQIKQDGKINVYRPVFDNSNTQQNQINQFSTDSNAQTYNTQIYNRAISTTDTIGPTTQAETSVEAQGDRSDESAVDWRIVEI